MAEVTRKRTGELLRKAFEILIPLPEGLPARDVLAAVERAIPLTPYEEADYSSGGRRFEKIVRFATVDAVKAGWLHKTKGRWIATDAGRIAFREYPEPEAFYRRAVKLYREWRASQPDSEAGMPDETADDSSGKAATITFEEASEQAWNEIEQYLREMKPYDFQELVAGLLRAMGYHVSWVAPPGRDGGIDIVAGNDPLGTKPPRIKVQVKRQIQTVSVDGLRSFMAILGDEDVGLFVCTGGFTRDAEEAARGQERRRITLVNLEDLVDLWIEHYDRLNEDARRRLPLRPIHFLSPEG